MVSTGSVVFAAWAFLASADAVTVGKNPIRKVVTMLQDMKTKVTEEGEREEKAFNAFMCYCKSGLGDLEQQIEDSKTRIDTLASEIKENVQKKKMTEQSLKEHQESRKEAKETVAKATSLREEEAKAFHAEKADTETNMDAVRASVEKLTKGTGGAFLQSTSSKVLSRYVMERATLDDEARNQVLEFLSGSSSEAYAPASRQITGILKAMRDEMAKNLEDAVKTEESAKQVFEQMFSAKTKEINCLTEQIEEEMMRLGELNVLLAERENDLEDTKETLAEDTKYLAELEKGCKTKEGEWEERCKVRSEELVALSDTIKVLSDDDALDLFKKTLPSSAASSAASFLQLKAKRSGRPTGQRARAAGAVLKGLGVRSARLDLVLLALQGKKAGFEDVIQLIAKMEKTLHHEQEQDDKKRDYCNSEIDKTEDDKKELEHSIEVSGTAIEELQGTITTVQEEMKTLKAGIEDLDKSVAEATKIRKEQNSEFKALEKENIAAKEVLRWAKNRLNKFYNPKLYTAESSDAAEALVETSADGAPPPPPETFGAYTKKTEESGGVIAMITKIIQEIDVTMAEAKTEEKDSQEDYQELMSNAGSKRTADSKALTEKAASLAEAEEALQAEVEKKAGLVEEREQTMRTLMNLHGECDWILKYFDVRRQARDDELDALGKARDVLNGADYSL